MSTTYALWRASADKAEARRCIYVCGPERLLVQEVIDTTVEIVHPTHLDYVTLSAERESAAEVWAQANWYPLTPGAARLVVVRDAEKLRDWTPLQGWLANARRLPTTHLLFVANTHDVPDTDYITLLRKRSHGQVVRCSTPNPNDAIAWVRRRAGLDVEMATRLLNRVDWHLSDAADACAKLALFGGNHGRSAIDAVTYQSSGDLVEYLLADDKRAALGAVDQLTQATFGLLASRVDALGRLWTYVKAGIPAREMRDVPPFLIAKYMPVAATWDPKRCTHARRVLAVVEDVYRMGARSGVAEALVALW